MPKFVTEHYVRFSPRQMYDLVADVERYPQFLPLCESLTIRSREEIPEGTTLIATMNVGYRALRETFTTRVRLDPAHFKINVAYLDGPFRHLENRWIFCPAEGGGTDVGFYIAYELRSALLSAVIGSVFDRAFRRFTHAFEERAEHIYGQANFVACLTV